MFLKKMNTRRWRTLVLLQRKMNKDEDGKEEDEADDDAGTFKLFKKYCSGGIEIDGFNKKLYQQKISNIKN